MNATTTIEHVVHIDATPAAVYDMWTTEAGLCAWWAQRASVDLRPGGALRVDIDGQNVMVGEFVEITPPDRIRFTFGWADGEPAPGSTEVDVRIEPSGSGSRLTLRHHGLPIEFVELHARGWQHFVGDRLADLKEIS